MKTIKELLQLVYDYERKERHMGLCSVVHRMYFFSCINIDEYDILIDYIKDNKPKNVSENNAYWFPMFNWQPRNKWLLKHINLNK